MNTTHEVSGDKPRVNTVAYLITEGLGYCCEHIFWSTFQHVSAELVAARFGIAERTVRRHRQWWKDGSLPCEKRACCLEGKLRKP